MFRWWTINITDVFPGPLNVITVPPNVIIQVQISSMVDIGLESVKYAIRTFNPYRRYNLVLICDSQILPTIKMWNLNRKFNLFSPIIWIKFTNRTFQWLQPSIHHTLVKNLHVSNFARVKWRFDRIPVWRVTNIIQSQFRELLTVRPVTFRKMVAAWWCFMAGKMMCIWKNETVSRCYITQFTQNRCVFKRIVSGNNHLMQKVSCRTVSDSQRAWRPIKM